MSYYPEPDNHIRDKVKVVLGFSNYVTQKKKNPKKPQATGDDTSDLAAKKILLL